MDDSMLCVDAVSSWQLRRSVLEKMLVSGQCLEPCVPLWRLEQLGRELPVGEPQQELAVEPEQQPGLPAGRSSAWAVAAFGAEPAAFPSRRRVRRTGKMRSDAAQCW
jgi:hypothetical protein